LTNPRRSKRSTIEPVLLARTSVYIGAPVGLRDEGGGDALISRSLGNAYVDQRGFIVTHPSERISDECPSGIDRDP
jgi:hypothetical protein